MASNHSNYDIRRKAFDSRGRAFVKEVIKGMAARSVIYFKF